MDAVEPLNFRTFCGMLHKFCNLFFVKNSDNIYWTGWPNLGMKCGFCNLHSVLFITRSKMLLVWLPYGRFPSLPVSWKQVLLVTPRCEIVMYPGRFLVKKYTEVGITVIIIQTTQVRYDRMWHVHIHAATSILSFHYFYATATILKDHSI